MIYQGAAYRIIYLYGTKCKQVKSILETAIERAQGNYSITEKAWIMRMAFDQILGVPTQTKYNMSKTALITGVSSGIGLELAKIHASKGNNLVLVARNKSKLDELKLTIKRT